MKTIGDLEDRARAAISRGEEWVKDLAASNNKPLEELKRTEWFRVAVMSALTENREWRHLQSEVQAL